ncbi:MAG: DegT/DnrJ/EryC1/StrS family aminotransferase [Candidatus Omnitrophota bacterium]|jgi:dTDP-4-amino-4,6-dideoxygalactose transaminase
MIEHSRPTLGQEEKKAVLKILASNYIAEGPEVHRFEDEVAAYIGSSGAVATSTGTLGLHLALLCLDLKPGGEIIIPSYTCRSVLNAILYCRAKPVLCDIDLDTYNLSVTDTQKKITNRTQAIIVPHMFGYPAPVGQFKKLGVPIIEDCAHALGTEYQGRKAGHWGDLALLSFEGTKYIVTGEGGMVLANSSRLLSRLRRLKERDSRDFLVKYTYRMTDLQAAIGRAQLIKLENFIKKRRAIANIYDKALTSVTEKHPMDCINGRHIYQRYMIQVRGNIRELMKQCLQKGIKVKQPVKPYPLHHYLGLSGRLFPNTEHVMRSAVSVPIYPSLTKKEISHITQTLPPLLKRYA